jgi:hypothetical protein
VRNALKINPYVIRSFGRFGAEIKKKENLLVQLEIAVRGILKKDTKKHSTAFTHQLSTVLFEF